MNESVTTDERVHILGHFNPYYSDSKHEIYHDVDSDLIRIISISEPNISVLEDKIFIKYCKDNELIYELNELENLHLKEILKLSLINLQRFLEEKKSDKFDIRVYLWEDVDAEDWQQVVIEVRTTYSNLEEMDNLWDYCINILNNTYNDYINRVKIVETQAEIEAKSRISIIIEDLYG